MRYLKIAAGVSLTAAAYAFITVPKGLVNGGVTGFSMILSKLSGWDVALVSNLVTLLLLLVCLIFLGKEYFSGTVVACGLYMALFWLFHQIPSPFRALPSAVCVVIAAVAVGIGYSLCISAKSTMVGFDTVAIILNRYQPKINIAFAMYCINVAVLLCGIATYGIVSVLYGVAFSLIQSLILNLSQKKPWKRCRAAESLPDASIKETRTMEEK